MSESGKSIFAFGIVAIAFGAATIALNSLSWYYSELSISIGSQAYQVGLVTRFFVVEGIAISAIVLGIYIVYRGLLSIRLAANSTSVGSVISDALASARDRRIGVLSGVFYGAIYALVSSNVVFQPGVNFASAYGATSASLNTVACCGSPGTVPAFIVVLLPQAHLGLQILPLGLLFQVVFPILVGFNMTIVSYSLISKQVRITGGWVSALAVAAGLFTGCPTCAGLFLASAFGGTASAVALALAPYQILFIVISIPILLASPILVATSIKKSMYASCRLPPRASRPLLDVPR